MASYDILAKSKREQLVTTESMPLQAERLNQRHSSEWFFLQKRLETCQPRLRHAWQTHFVLTILVVVSGIVVNGGDRKYVPADPTKITSSCQKVFVNVLASNAENVGAIVCCDGLVTSTICAPKPNFLPFAARLTRFPDAWLIPLCPIIWRLLVGVFHSLRGSPQRERLTTTLVRLTLYIATLSFRGWILYLGLNWLEDQLVMPADEDCWYGQLLRRPSCQSRVFDFSDHTVFYLAHLLPLPLMEVLHQWVMSMQMDKLGLGLTRPPLQCVSIVMSLCLVYLYTITLMGQYKTAAYFHSGSEIIAGYVISLSVQIPCAFLQCTPYWDRLRQLIFGHPPARGNCD